MNDQQQKNILQTPAIRYFLTSQESLRAPKPEIDKPGEKIHVSEAISKVSSLYEYLRISAEYTEEHLIFRNVIERILKRRIFIQMQGESKELAGGLIKELISGGYLPNDVVHIDVVRDVGRIIDRYLAILDAIQDRSSDFNDFIIQLASVEIDREFNKVEREKEEAFAHFSLMAVRDRIQWSNIFSGTKEHNLQIYIAVLRTIVKYDDAQVYFALFRNSISGWDSLSPQAVAEQATRVEAFWKNSPSWMKHPYRETYLRVARQLYPAFVSIRDVFNQHPQQMEAVFSDPTRLERAVSAVAQARYDGAKSRLRSRAMRATIYIFLTKMLMALGIEVPYDLLFAKHFDALPLAINLLFPPALMFFMGATTPLPGKNNTERIIKDVRRIVYVNDNGEMLRIVSAPKQRGILEMALFGILLLGLFVFSYGLFIFLLRILRFSVVSGGVFIFFLTVVSLFSYRIRRPVRELFVKTFESARSTLLFLVTYPLVIVGYFLSDGAAKINIPVIVLDIFIEAPLKSFLEVGEDWLSFLREKQEEIV